MSKYKIIENKQKKIFYVINSETGKLITETESFSHAQKVLKGARNNDIFELVNI